MILTIYLPAGEGHRYSNKSFDGVPGRTIDVILGDGRKVPATVRSAKVQGWGAGVDLTIEVENADPRREDLWEAFRAGLTHRLDAAHPVSYVAFEEWLKEIGKT